MRKKKSLYNIISAVALQIVTLIIGIILPRILIKMYGSEMNGLVSSARQFINYLTLVEAGIAGSAIFELYKPLAEKKVESINSILSSSKRLYNKSGIIFSMLVLFLSFIFPMIMKRQGISQYTSFLLIIIIGFNGSLEFFSMGKYRVLLTADQKSYVISIVQIVGQFVNCVIIVTGSFMKCNLVLVQFLATSSYIVRTLLFSLYVKVKYKNIDFKVKDNKISFKSRWDVLIHQITGMIIFNSPIIIISLFCSLIDVSIYSIYNMVFSGILGVVAIFNNGLMATFGNIISQNETLVLKKRYSQYEYMFYMVVTFVYSSSYILIIPFISIYTKGITDVNYTQPTLGIAFVLIGILNTLRTPQSTLVNSAGHFRQTRNRAILEAIINLVASISFVNIFGFIGVLFGAMCSYAYRTIDFILYTPKNITKLPVRDTLVRILRMILLFILIILPFIKMIDIKVGNFTDWIRWAGLVSLWSGIVIFVGNYIFEAEYLKFIIYKCKLIIFKFRRYLTVNH